MEATPISNTAIWWLCIACGVSMGMLFYLFIRKWLTPGWEYGGMINEADYYDPIDESSYWQASWNLQDEIDFFFAQHPEDDANQIDYVKRWWGE